MIDSSEFRIGNILWNGVVVKIAKDYFIFNDGIQDWDSRNLIEGSIKPLPITKELLNEKCGAINESIKINENSELFFSFVTVGCGHEAHRRVNEGKVILYEDENPKYNMDCEYLHQLQNIFRYLSKKELEIKI